MGPLDCLFYCWWVPKQQRCRDIYQLYLLSNLTYNPYTQNHSSASLLTEQQRLSDQHSFCEQESLYVLVGHCQQMVTTCCLLQSLYNLPMYFKNQQRSYLPRPISRVNHLPYLPILSPHYLFTLHQFSVQPNHFQSRMAEGKGKWSTKEQQVYIEFLEENIEQMSCAVSRKAKKVFLKMSREVRTRSADQCRSHHQKILKYHESVQDIISTYRQRLCGSQTQIKQSGRGDTGMDLFVEQGFYKLEKEDNKLAIIINQSAIQFYSL